MRFSLFSSLLLQVLAAPLAHAEAPPQFRFERMRVAGRLGAVHAEDVNADGKRDLLAVYTTGAPPETKRFIAIFLDHNGAYQQNPDQVIPSPPGASFIDVGDVDGDAAQEILFGDSRGLGYLPTSTASPTYGEARRLVAIEGLALLPEEDDLPFLDVARDWDGDGKPEILLPMPDRVAILTRGAEAWTRTGELRLPPRAVYQVRGDLYEPRARNFSLRAVLTVPQLERGDFDGDGRPDLIAVLDDRVTVFRGQPQGLFAPVPIAKIHLGVRTEAEAARGSASVQVTALDFDGDGIVDLAVNKVTGGISSMRGQTGFYFGRKGGGYERPAQVISREGFSGVLMFGDLDGDKHPEMVMAHASVGFAEMARVLLSKRMTVNFEVHRNLGRKGFSPAADAERPIDFVIDATAGAELDGPFPSLDGDFNGDGLVDFAGPKGDGLAVWLGGGKAMLAEYPKATVHVPLTRFWQVLDLDGDKRADVILFYRFRAEMLGQIVVLRNTGRGW